MSETDQEKMDTVLRRMLATPPTPHKPLGVRLPAAEKGQDESAACCTTAPSV